MQNDIFSVMPSSIRVKPTSNVRFIAEELRRYGIATKGKEEEKKSVFFQSAHLIRDFGVSEESFAIVSFKDLFAIVGKNPEGVDKQDISRVWKIAESLERRGMVNILGTSNHLLGEDDQPPEAHLDVKFHHIHRKDSAIDSFIYRSKFAINKKYKIQVEGHNNRTLYGISDFLIVGE